MYSTHTTNKPMLEFAYLRKESKTNFACFANLCAFFLQIVLTHYKITSYRITYRLFTDYTAQSADMLASVLDSKGSYYMIAAGDMYKFYVYLHFMYRAKKCS